MGDKTVNTTMPLYHRCPRTYLAPPTAELELQPPQGKPARPTSSLVAVLLPLGFTLLGLGLTVAFLATSARTCSSCGAYIDSSTDDLEKR
jgi:hypothetical protein